MNWGYSYQVNGEKGLLYWALEGLLDDSHQYKNNPFAADARIKEMMQIGNGIGGHLYWIIKRIKVNNDSPSYFKVSSDPDYHTTDIATEATFSESEFKQALNETLLAYAEAYPDKTTEVFDMIRQFDL
jgi:hypothetical protein